MAKKKPTEIEIGEQVVSVALMCCNIADEADIIFVGNRPYNTEEVLSERVEEDVLRAMTTDMNKLIEERRELIDQRDRIRGLLEDAIKELKLNDLEELKAKTTENMDTLKEVNEDIEEHRVNIKATRAWFKAKRKEYSFR